jgi:hypothetical protein
MKMFSHGLRYEIRYIFLSCNENFGKKDHKQLKKRPYRIGFGNSEYQTRLIYNLRGLFTRKC